jgi:hypothetical protein
MTKRKADIIRAAQCPECGEFMEKLEIRNEAKGTCEIVWRCTNKKCQGKV